MAKHATPKLSDVVLTALTAGACTLPEISARTGRVYATVGSTLHRLTKAGKVRRVGYGRYVLSTTSTPSQPASVMPSAATADTSHLAPRHRRFARA
jgi:hypothetical protein